MAVMKKNLKGNQNKYQTNRPSGSFRCVSVAPKFLNDIMNTAFSETAATNVGKVSMTAAEDIVQFSSIAQTVNNTPKEKNPSIPMLKNDIYKKAFAKHGIIVE